MFAVCFGPLRREYPKVPVTKNGKAKQLELPEAIAERVKKEALTGPLKSLELGIRLANQYGPSEEETMVPVFDFESLSPEDRVALRNLLGTVEYFDKKDFLFVRRKPKMNKD